MNEINQLINIYEERLAGSRGGMTAETMQLLALARLVKSHEARLVALEAGLEKK